MNSANRIANTVAPLAGAWIETISENAPILKGGVAPLAGAWIETLDGSTKMKDRGDLSHPSRVRGLKLITGGEPLCQARSHPSRVRGLKLPHPVGP